MAFIQLPKELIRYISPAGLLAYAIIADKCRLKDRSCYISQKAMGEQLMMSDRSVRKLIKTLEYLRLIKFDGYSSAGTARYICPELTSELISDVQWKLAGGRWENISDVAEGEIRGHKRGTSETISDLLRKPFPTSNNDIIKRQSSGRCQEEKSSPPPQQREEDEDEILAKKKRREEAA